jgi:hypothetical protein
MRAKPFRLVVLDGLGVDWIEVSVSAYPHDAGPALDFHKLGIHREPQHLMTLPLPAVRGLVRLLPTAINAAYRAKP